MMSELVHAKKNTLSDVSVLVHRQMLTEDIAVKKDTQISIWNLEISVGCICFNRIKKIKVQNTTSRKI